MTGFARFCFLAVIYLSGIFAGLSQEPQEKAKDTLIRNQITLRHDNDFLMFTDRYYTSGLFLTYRRRLSRGIFSSGKEQFSIRLLQELYTPSEIHTEAIRKLDRPYVGFHGVDLGWSRLHNNSVITARVLLGLAGEASGAGAFQRWYHTSVVEARPPAWVAEMESSAHLNIYANYTYEWELSANPFSVFVSFNPKAAFGTRDIYFEPGIKVHFGKRDVLTSSLAYSSLESAGNEVFCSISAGYRFVGHNAFLEGNLAGDDSSFLVASRNRVFYAGLDINHRSGMNDYSLGYRINSPETEKVNNHKYIILSYARSF